MRGAATAFCVALCLAASPGAARKPPMRSFASPSSIFAEEIALNRLAREKGQWTALRETAADGAVMFVPQKVTAETWLKGRADPPQPIQRQAESVYISCDRRTAAATGLWQGPGGAQGIFTRIWRLDKKGRWKWALDYRGSSDPQRERKDFLEGHVAECRKSERMAGGAVPSPGERRGTDEGAVVPPDDSLLWSPDEGGKIVVKFWNGSAYETVIEENVAAQP